MEKFNSQRISYHYVNDKKFKHPIPVAIIKPENVQNKPFVLLRINGIGAAINDELYFNDWTIFKNNYMICFDKCGYGINKNHPSQFVSTYLNEILAVVKWIKNQFNDLDIYIIADSWGGNLSCCFYKKYYYLKLIKGLIIWNTPTKVININKISCLQLFKIGLKLITTYLTNINFIDDIQENYNKRKLTTNLIILRASNIIKYKNTTRTLIAVWRSIRMTKKFLLKSFNKNKYNIHLIQSADDAMINKKFITFFSKHYQQNFYYLSTGFHILHFERSEAPVLNNIIKKIIML